MPRLDSKLVEKGIARSRERAKEMIKAGNVTVNGNIVTKSAYEVSDEDEIASSEQELYVGRGALKLEKAVKAFNIDLSSRVCLDIGASTGGFTDYMLKQGASKVYAVDVGHGQLAESLRNNTKVVNMEGTDIRKLSAEDFDSSIDFVCTDVSFISLKLIIPKILEIASDNADIVLLIKPQFEAGRKDIGKGGIVKDKKVHIRVLTDIDSFIQQQGAAASEYTFSPVKGGSGNIEYLVHIIKKAGTPVLHDFKELVERSFKEL
ncbi:MAG: TlyA family RNA methyltransferase [Ruminococcus sp.]|nr:TlyA family RNA methyltransferase [Ruminococcus sp.]